MLAVKNVVWKFSIDFSEYLVHSSFCRSWMVADILGKMGQRVYFRSFGKFVFVFSSEHLAAFKLGEYFFLCPFMIFFYSA